MQAPRIALFAGSARTASINKRLARAAAQLVDAAGGSATFIDLADYTLPLYHGDLEAADGVPENARRLKRLLAAHDGLAIAAPENNASLTALLKNTIDWLSRPDAATAGVAPFQGKVAALLSASPGALGGLRGLVHLRAILENREVVVLPRQYALARAADAFDADGELKSTDARNAVADLMKQLVDVARRLARREAARVETT